MANQSRVFLYAHTAIGLEKKSLCKPRNHYYVCVKKYIMVVEANEVEEEETVVKKSRLRSKMPVRVAREWESYTEVEVSYGLFFVLARKQWWTN